MSHRWQMATLTFLTGNPRSWPVPGLWQLAKEVQQQFGTASRSQWEGGMASDKVSDCIVDSWGQVPFGACVHSCGLPSAHLPTRLEDLLSSSPATILVVCRWSRALAVVSLLWSP